MGMAIILGQTFGFSTIMHRDKTVGRTGKKSLSVYFAIFITIPLCFIDLLAAVDCCQNTAVIVIRDDFIIRISSFSNACLSNAAFFISAFTAIKFVFRAIC